jgi:renalase
MSKIKNKKIAIIGAGISGIVLADKLAASNEVTVFDKSRGIGGRMATKRTDDYQFDHGAQFFTAKSEEFKEFCHKAKQENIIEDWQCRFVEIVGNNIDLKPQFKNHPHFVAKPQMNNLCKYIGKDLNILLNQQIESINFDNQKWSFKTTNNKIFENFDYLFLAIPSHQAIKLIPKNFKYFDLVANIKMSSCFTLMLGFKDGLEMDFDAALVTESIISWISINNSKPERPKGFSLVINSSNEWADKNIEKDLEVVKKEMIATLRKIIAFDIDDIDCQNIHRWKYANAKSRQGEKSLFDSNLNLGICGDWLSCGRVENAFLSGLDQFQKLKSLEI